MTEVMMNQIYKTNLEHLVSIFLRAEFPELFEEMNLEEVKIHAFKSAEKIVDFIDSMGILSLIHLEDCSKT